MSFSESVIEYFIESVIQAGHSLVRQLCNFGDKTLALDLSILNPGTTFRNDGPSVVSGVGKEGWRQLLTTKSA